MGKDVISVIIPIYNGELYIERCLNSIVNQTYEYLEIILVNDGSSDRSENICIEWKKRDKRIHLYSQVNKGVSEARNLGMSKATGKYIAFVDVDDTCESDMYYCLHERISKTHSDIVYCGLNRRNQQNVILRQQAGIDSLQCNISVAIEQLKEKYYDCMTFNRLFLRERIWNDNYQIKFKNCYAIGEDYVWLLEVLRKCNSVSAINKYLYNYYMIEGSASHSICLDKRNLYHLYALEECSRNIESMVNTGKNDPKNRLYIQARILTLIAYVKKDYDYLREIEIVVRRNQAEKYWFINRENSNISKMKQVFMNITYKLRVNGKITLWIYNFARDKKLEIR
ncbi:MAG: glycosyltransferase [Lachnospiraceae bacterium]|nr:glycosyltransferase [Lachnospiraceae bacterium]